MSLRPALLLVLAVACSRDKAAPAPPSSSAPEANAVRPDPPPEPSYRLPGADRVVAIGDVHGDLAATRAALRLAGAIDSEDDWVGGRLTVVQTGDQLDRGDDERAILDLFERLKQAAPKAGGRFIALNGNHETMTVAGDFRYVTEGGFGAFEGMTPSSDQAAQIGRLPPIVQGRAAAFFPGGEYSRKLAEQNVVVVVGDTAFVHGGVLPKHVQYGIDRINAEVKSWMRGSRPVAPEVITAEDAPVWSRAYGTPVVPARICAELDQVLAALQAKRMVIGHTVQQDGISSACNDRVFRIDVGLARAYGSRPAEVLEIRPDGVRVLRASLDAGLVAPSDGGRPSKSAPVVGSKP